MQVTKYNKKTVERILDALRNGNTQRAACYAAGIGYSAYDKWRKLYPDFADAVEQAKEYAAQTRIDIIRKAADGWDEEEVTTTENEKGEVKVVRKTSRKFDWRAALADLQFNPHTRGDWGQRIDVSDIDDDTLITLLTKALARKKSEDAADQ